MKAKSKIEPGRPEFMIGAHCLNHNAHSIGICYEGGLDIRGQPADTCTPEQKACPCIENVAREYADLQPK